MHSASGEAGMSAASHPYAPGSPAKAGLMSHDPSHIVLAVELGILLVLYAVGVHDYGPLATNVSGPSGAAAAAHVGLYYGFFIHVMIMIYVGFGFLMTFLRRFSYSASVMVFLWNILNAGFWKNVKAGHAGEKIELDLPLMTEGLFGAGSAMIAFGVVIGKASPAQMFFLSFWQIIFYAFNIYIDVLNLGASDAGGSMVIHVFGAYFGLAASMAMHSKSTHGFYKQTSSRTTSDVTAMIGTLFLFIMWPSFNGGLVPAGGQFRAIVNTSLSLASATMATFIASRYFRAEGKFCMVDVQNATLAGGVAMGSCANLHIGPPSAIAIGIIAGVVSTAGFNRLLPWLEKKIGLHDTCGVHNLHGMPGVIGGLASIIAVGAAKQADYGDTWGDTFGVGVTPAKLAGVQAATLAITLAIALVSGWVGGKIALKLGPHLSDSAKFEDTEFWEVCDDYEGVGVRSKQTSSDRAPSASPAGTPTGGTSIVRVTSIRVTPATVVAM